MKSQKIRVLLGSLLGAFAVNALAVSSDVSQEEISAIAKALVKNQPTVANAQFI